MFKILATVGKISSTAGYDAAIDGLLQLLCLSQSSRDLVCPTEIQSLVIDIPKVSSALQSGVVGTVHPELNIVSCVGAEIEGVKFTQAPEVLVSYTLNLQRETKIKIVFISYRLQNISIRSKNMALLQTTVKAHPNHPKPLN